jgi:signal transduction histidine kinase
VVKTGEAASLADYKVIQQDGDPKDLELSVSLIRDAAGQPAGFRGVVRDVSERKRGEAERKKLEGRLQQAQKMEAIGTLAGGIAHDFNNILMGILGNASLLDLRLDPGHAGHEKIQNIEKYVESGTELSRQLLGFARRGKYNVKASDINEIIVRVDRRMKGSGFNSPPRFGRWRSTAARSSRCCSTSASTPGRPCPTAGTST